MSIIALAGSHRVGKSTLARAYAHYAGFTLIETQSSMIFQEMGYSPQEDYPINIRLKIQHAILDCYVEQMKQVDDFAIADRSPLDMAAYMLADAGRKNLTDKDAAMITQYVDRCQNTVSRFCKLALIIQPGIPLVADPTKAPINVAYIEHINALILGVSMSAPIPGCRIMQVPRHITDMEKRINAIDSALASIESEAVKVRERMVKMGVTIH